MSILDGLTSILRSLSKRDLLLRALLAAPFALALILTLVLGPATINNGYASFVWLAFLSLAAALLMLGPTGRLLIAVGLVTFFVFPLISGLGFNFAPPWARPVAAVVFYGSMLASTGAVLAGIVHVVRRWSRSRRLRALCITAGVVVLSVGAAIYQEGPDSICTIQIVRTVKPNREFVRTANRYDGGTNHEDCICSTGRLGGDLGSDRLQHPERCSDGRGPSRSFFVSSLS